MRVDLGSFLSVTILLGSACAAPDAAPEAPDSVGNWSAQAKATSATADWTAESDQSRAYFGSSVASAGDVNGDGYDDVVVGAYAYDNGGRAYLYLGSGTGLDTTAVWTAESDQSEADFGSSVASAGDVNGDGYDDVVVGAPFYANGEGYEGRAYLYPGSGTGLDAAASWTAESDQSGAYFGSAASAGDVNGDGYDDVVVGAYGYTNGETYEGRAFLYLGSATGLDTAASWTAESDQSRAYFGVSAASAGDVNGDGYDDVVVGAYGYDNGQSGEGRGYLYLGSATGLDTAASWTAESDQLGAYFGYSVASAGDVNGDGYDDVVVGAIDYTNGESWEGGAYLYLGSATGLDTSASWTAESDQGKAYFGRKVASAGDVNGDGYDDVVVGAPGYDNGRTMEGRAYLYLGSATGLGTAALWTAESHHLGAYFGLSVASAGDVSGDGYDDVVVGAPYYDNGESYEGRAYLYLGPMDGDWDGYDADDCDDTDASVYPGASEIVNDGIDQDCDGVDSCYTDADGDGSTVVIDGSSLSCDSGLGATNADDCDDTSASVYPGASEMVNDGIDQDCDGVDDCYTDGDGDGYGSTVVIDGSSLSCDSGLGATNADDCDDASASVYPSAPEGVADGIDQDCDGVDSCYTDADGDGSTVVIDGSSLTCDSGLGATATDCDDTDASVYPGVLELEDGLDNDCDGVVDEGTDAYDDDKDGFSENADDCDDTSASIYLGASETVNDGIDQDCDGVDSCYTDADGDGYGSRVHIDGSSLSCESGPGVSNAADCDDTDASVYPGVLEFEDGLDNDCDGAVDEGSDVYDDDEDGFSENADDCDDSSASVYPGAPEAVADGIDQDCDGVDSCYTDADGDGYGSTLITTGSSLSCDSGLEATNADDCDDASNSVYLGASEIVADGIDQDCDGVDSCYTDTDGDGYGGTVVIDGTSLSCDSGRGVTTSDDCDDNRVAWHPGADESDCADPNDYNCDGSVGGTDADADGYPACTECNDADAAFHPGADESDCADPNDYNCDGSVGETDADEDGFSACEECDDAEPGVNPGAMEVVADAVDENCDGSELCFEDVDQDGYGSEVSVPSDDLDCDDPGEASADGPRDCDDTDGSFHPGAEELDCADPNDYNCDGSVAYADIDEDTFAACTECDDENAAVNPGAEEVCNGIDDNCDGTVDDDAIDAEIWYADADGDGTTDPGDAITGCTAPEGYTAATEDDCDDSDPDRFPGAEDVPDDGVDQDCDGLDKTGLSGCGCASQSGGALAWSLVLGGLALTMRRRHRV